ncbi:hypothetical protein M1432_00840 [Patescibacteria group bacterium]|nr:hypothetical protein [Patescibacteria group bacterium]
MLLFSVVSPPASAQTQSASQTMDVNLTVAPSMQLNVTRMLDFGSQVQGTTSITVDPVTGGASAGAATLTSAPASQVVTVAWSSTSITNGSTNIAWTPSVAGNTVNTQTGATILTTGNTVTASSGGDYYLWAGGTIASIPAATPTGAYTGTLILTVSY